MKVLQIAIALFLLSALVGCGSTKTTPDYVVNNPTGGFNEDEIKETLQDNGLFGEHELVRFRITEHAPATIEGRFFLGTGAISGTEGSQDSLKFAWSPRDGTTLISHLPLEKVIILTDNTKTTPTIQFQFDLNRAIERTWVRQDNATTPTANDFVDPKYITAATVRINEEQLKSEIYLPFNPNGK